MGRVRVIFAVMLAIVCVSTAMLWWRSRTHSDVLAISTPDGRMQALASHRGGVVGFASDVPFQADGGGYFDGVDCPAEDLDDINDSVFDKTAVVRSAIGFKLATSTLAVGAMPRDYYAVRVPHWAVIAASGVMFVVLARGPLRRRRWRKQGRCTACGYDLRESPERCPECGTATAGAEAERGKGWRMRMSRKQAVVGVVILAGLAAGRLALRRLIPPPGGWQPEDAVVRVYPAGDLADSSDWPPGGLLAWKASLAHAGKQEMTPDDWRGVQLEKLAEAMNDLPSTNVAAQAFAEAGTWTHDRVLVRAPASVQREYAALVQALRSPVGAALMTIVAGESAPETRGVQDVRRKLATVMPEARFDRVGLEIAINQIREATRANIIVDWPNLEASGIDRNTPVELHVWDLLASTVLAEVLTSAGADTVILSYRVEEGLVRVTTPEQLAKSTELRIYDVRPLLRNAVASRRRLGEELGSPPLKPPSPGMPAAAAPFDAEDPYAAAADELVTIVQEAIDPDTWRPNGGSVGSIREWGGRLLIQQTPEGHRAVEGLLKQLSDAYAEGAASLPSSRPVAAGK